MRFSTTALALLSLAGSALSALTVTKYPGAAAGQYLVEMKDGVSKDNLIAQIKKMGGEVRYNLDSFNIFAGLLSLLGYRVRPLTVRSWVHR